MNAKRCEGRLLGFGVELAQYLVFLEAAVSVETSLFYYSVLSV